jgi:2-phosphosulfolactate phosphatase
VIAGERRGDPVLDFDLGNSAREFLAPRARAVVLTTTNGTRALVEAAANCDVVLAGSLPNLSAVAEAARIRGEDVEIVCAGVGGSRSDDDAYCAGRIVALLGGEPTESGPGPSSWRPPSRARRTRFVPRVP